MASDLPYNTGMDSKKDEQKPAEYQRPKLRRWGTLRELTAGGGGFKNEPVTKRQTRF